MPDGEDTKWMTYAELATARGIDRQSATRLVARRKWQRQRPNEGSAVKVAVPLSYLASPPDIRPDIPPDIIPDVRPDKMGDIGRVVSEFEGVRTFLVEQIQKEQRRVLQLEAALEQERRQADAERGRLLAQIEALTTKTGPEPVSRSRLSKLLWWLDKK